MIVFLPSSSSCFFLLQTLKPLGQKPSMCVYFLIMPSVSICRMMDAVIVALVLSGEGRDTFILGESERESENFLSLPPSVSDP